MWVEETGFPLHSTVGNGRAVGGQGQWYAPGYPDAHPGLEKQLVVGFCFTEGLVSNFSDIQLIEHCDIPSDEGLSNVINVN